MKNAEIKVQFPTDKLAALQEYARRKDLEIETELQDALGKLYEKLVPKPVQEYLDILAGTTPEEKKPSRPKQAAPGPEQSKPLPPPIFSGSDGR